MLSVRKSDERYYNRNYGVFAKVRENAKIAYVKLCNFLKWLSLTVTLFLIPVFIFAIIYYTFFSFNPVRAITCCVCLWVYIDSNSKL